MAASARPAGNQRTAQGGGQRVHTLVNCPGLERGEQELFDQDIPGVNSQGLGRAHRHRPLLDGRQVHHAQVHGQSNNFRIVPFLEPGHGHRGIQPTAVGQDDFVDI